MRTVLCCSGHDPTGGAGIQADIEAVGAQGVHALSVVTVLTVQDTTNVAQMSPVDEALLERQLELLLADCMPSAIKFGLLGGAAQLPVLAATLRRLAVPVVMDPILRAGGGRELVDAAFAEQVRLTLFPLDWHWGRTWPKRWPFRRPMSIPASKMPTASAWAAGCLDAT